MAQPIEKTIYQCNACQFQSKSIAEVRQHLKIHTATEEEPAEILPDALENVKNPLDVSKRWNQEMVFLLLSLYEENKPKFKSVNWTHKRVWALIAESIRQDGYQVTAEQCDVKWRNLKKQYKKILAHQARKGRKPVSWDYFNRMDEILGHLLDESYSININNNNNNTISTEARTVHSPLSTSSIDSAPTSPKTRNVQLRKIDQPNKNEQLNKNDQPNKKTKQEPPQWIKELEKARTRRHEERMKLHRIKINKMQEYQEKKIKLQEERMKQNKEFRDELLNLLRTF